MAEAGGLLMRLEDRVEILITHNIWVVAGPGRGQEKTGGGNLVEERIQRSNEDLMIEERSKGKNKNESNKSKEKMQKEKNAERIKFNNSGQIKREGVDKAKD